MKKLFSLIRACMTDNMSLFRIKNKRSDKTSKMILPIFIVLILFVSMYGYAENMIEMLEKVNLEIFLLTFFVLVFSILTLVEGIYKAGSLLFNSKDDNLLLSLPIKKSTVLFIKMFKFYVFELLYNLIFLLPAMFVYTRHVNVTITFYIATSIALLLLPIIPIIISCIIGGIITYSVAKFKFKNVFQIVITMSVLLAVFYFSFNFEKQIANITENAEHINEIITKVYYPAGAYIKLVTDFNVLDLIIYFFVHIGLFALTIFAFNKIYFKINSRVKNIKVSSKNSSYKVVAKGKITSLVKKEVNRFASSPVFVINAAFGLLLFLVGTIVACIKVDDIIQTIISRRSRNN